MRAEYLPDRAKTFHAQEQRYLPYSKNKGDAGNGSGRPQYSPAAASVHEDTGDAGQNTQLVTAAGDRIY